jgi:hypothetical protein
MRRFKRSLSGVLCAGAVALAGAAPAQGIAPEPDSIFVSPGSFAPFSVPLEGPCGLAVLPAGGFSGYLYVANYYLHNVARFSPSLSSPGGPDLKAVVSDVDPLDGPCGVDFDSTGRLYVNNYHRNVERYDSAGGDFAPPTVIDSSHPTGVAVNFVTGNVYVNSRTFVAGYDSTGAPLLDGGDPLKIGVGSLGDGYSLAVSGFPLTAGSLYIPDYSDNTVKVYDPLIDTDNPVQTIAGPPGGFGSLRDSAIAVDRVTGEIYVADTRAFPQYTERPEAAIHVFESTGAYKGRLKYNVVDASPPGLAVDNTTKVSQGRVFVTSGNTIAASIYAYPPNSETSVSAPASFSLNLETDDGSGSGSVRGKSVGIACAGVCEEQVRGGAEVSLIANPAPGSAFTGWTGGCSGTTECVVSMTQARSISAKFQALAGPLVPSPSGANVAKASGTPSASPSVVAQKGTLRVTVSGKLAPKRLPRHGAAPISVSVGGRISTTDKSLPPQLKTMRIELNRQGSLDTVGLPTCALDRIQPGSSGRALSACRPALVGKGSFTANITLAGQEPYPTKGQLLVFNGVEKGKPVLFGHIYSPAPFATSFVIIFRVEDLGKGTYGTALNAPLPKAMDAWGRLTSLEMTLSRRYSYKGESHSYISAGCPAPKGFSAAVFPLARTSFSFQGGKRLSSVLSSTCKTKG